MVEQEVTLMKGNEALAAVVLTDISDILLLRRVRSSRLWLN